MTRSGSTSMVLLLVFLLRLLFIIVILLLILICFVSLLVLQAVLHMIPLTHLQGALLEEARGVGQWRMTRVGAIGIVFASVAIGGRAPDKEYSNEPGPHGRDGYRCKI